MYFTIPNDVTFLVNINLIEAYLLFIVKSTQCHRYNKYSVSEFYKLLLRIKITEIFNYEQILVQYAKKTFFHR